MAFRPSALVWHRSVGARCPPPVMPTRRLVTLGGPGDAWNAPVSELAGNGLAGHTTLPMSGELYPITVSLMPATYRMDSSAAAGGFVTFVLADNGIRIFTSGRDASVAVTHPPWLCPDIPRRDRSTRPARNDSAPLGSLSASICALTSPGMSCAPVCA